MNRQDCVNPRTPAQLERQYGFGKTFAEVMGIALDAQTHAIKAEERINEWSQTVGDELEGVYAELNMKVGKDENGNLKGKLHIGANQLTIDTENFKLDTSGNVEVEGIVRAKSGSLGNWELADNGIWKISSDFAVHINAPSTSTSYVFSVAKFDTNNVQTMPFYVRADGFLYAKEAYIEGEINATRGNISGDVTCDALKFNETFTAGNSSNGTRVEGTDLHSILRQICNAITKIDTKVFINVVDPDNPDPGMGM